MDFITVLTVLMLLSSFVLLFYGLYYAIISFFSAKKEKDLRVHAPQKKFAAIIAARNESNVIGQLILSLKQQNYPAELLEIIVVPNNCTDNTKEVSLLNGATVIECTKPVKSKGEVLEFTFDYLLKEKHRFDAYCIFDADNLVDENFFTEMNNALCSGAQVAQGYRDSKNPADSFVSSCYSIYYYSLNRFYNKARNGLGLSAFINGTGFMVSSEFIRKLGGWNTLTMTEDVELTAICALNDIKIHWVHTAIVYDEQPITVLQSWDQRMRWSTGILQCFSTYGVRLLKKSIREKNFSCLDSLMLFMAPAMQILGFLSLLTTIVVIASKIEYFILPVANILVLIFIFLNGSYIIPTFIALLAVILEKKNVSLMMKGILTTWLFILSWLPINILCLFKKSVQWKEIEHTRGLTLMDLGRK